MKWTVYNEEKPQKVGSYLVTHTTDSGHYYVDYDYWTVCDNFKYHPTDVVAWMPFPKPYSKTEPQTNGYQTFNGTSVYVSRLEDEPQTDEEWYTFRDEQEYNDRWERSE